MKLFEVVENSGDSEDWTWGSYWAADESAAIAAFHSQWGQEFGVVDADELSIKATDRTDEIPDAMRSDIACQSADSVNRILGWHYECDDSCDTCGLYSMGGKYPVCEDCRQCDECGCDCEKAATNG